MINAAKLYYSKLLVLRKEETRTTPEKEGKGEKEGQFTLKSTENNVAEECSEYRKVPKELEECSLEQVRNILNGLASLEKEEQVKFLSIALGNVVIIKKGERFLCHRVWMHVLNNFLFCQTFRKICFVNSVRNRNLSQKYDLNFRFE